MASPWDDFWPKFLLTVVDKAILGIAIAVLGYWFQKRLEIFKRNQALTAEHAKASIAAYHRVFGALTAFEVAVALLLMLAEDKEPWASAEAKAAVFKDRREKWFDELKTLRTTLLRERHLVGANFSAAVASFVAQCRSDIAELRSDVVLDAATIERKDEVLTRLRKAVDLCLPPFARPPAEDLHFSAPDLDAVLAQITAAELQQLKKGKAP